MDRPGKLPRRISRKMTRDAQSAVGFGSVGGYGSPYGSEAYASTRMRSKMPADSAHARTPMYTALPTDDDNMEEDQRPQTVWTHLEDFIFDVPFQVIMAIMIIGNSLAIGMETDMPHLTNWDLIENIFLFVFTAELLLKWLVLGFTRFFDINGMDFSWNLFDLFVVSLGCADFLVGLFADAGSGGFATLFRIIRLLRILRIFRIVRFLKQLYLLAFGLAEALQAVFWVTLLMTFVLYVCSIILVRTVGTPPDDDANYEFLRTRFGDIPRSMLTLFELMASPNLPEYQAQGSLLWRRPVMTLFLVGFVIFGSFGMIALLTGVISESMFEKNQLRMEEERLEREEQHQQILAKCEKMFDTLEVNALGEVASQAIKDKLLPNIRKLFEAASVDFSDHELNALVVMMDTDNSGYISKDEFCHGILSLANGVRSISMQEIFYEVKVTKNKLEKLEVEFAGIVTAAVRDAVRQEFSVGGSPQLVSWPPFNSDAHRQPSRPSGGSESKDRIRSSLSNASAASEYRMRSKLSNDSAFSSGSLVEDKSRGSQGPQAGGLNCTPNPVANSGDSCCAASERLSSRKPSGATSSRDPRRSPQEAPSPSDGASSSTTIQPAQPDVSQQPASSFLQNHLRPLQELHNQVLEVAYGSPNSKESAAAPALKFQDRGFYTALPTIDSKEASTDVEMGAPSFVSKDTPSDHDVGAQASTQTEGADGADAKSRLRSFDAVETTARRSWSTREHSITDFWQSLLGDGDAELSSTPHAATTR